MLRLTATRFLSSASSRVSVTFLNADRKGKTVTVEGRPGDSLLETAWEAGADLEGACDHCMACTTCHVYVEEGMEVDASQLEDEELDALDVAFEPRDNSRLARQVRLRRGSQPLVVRVPEGVTNQLE